jgi:hypothetical protein
MYNGFYVGENKHIARTRVKARSSRYSAKDYGEFTVSSRGFGNLAVELIAVKVPKLNNSSLIGLHYIKLAPRSSPGAIYIMAREKFCCLRHRAYTRMETFNRVSYGEEGHIVTLSGIKSISPRNDEFL